MSLILNQLMTTNSYFIAVDAGGSKCHAVLFEQLSLKPVAQCTTGPANLASDYKLALKNIQQAIKSLLSEHNLAELELKNIPVYAGIAGVNYPKVASKLSQWQHPYADFYFTTDLHLACYAAHQQAQGNVIIVGTGSCAIAINQGKTTVLGGYGHKLGDQASAAWFGLQALQHTLLVLDNVESGSLLANKVCQFSELDSAIELSQYWHNASPSQIGQLARCVFESADEGDASALEIIEQAINYLSRLATQLNYQQNSPICLMGGLSDIIQAYLPPALKQQIISAKYTQPVFGGLILFQTPELALNYA
ncbi:hypothetical protein N7931_13615 [Catenovulum sp. 2E275]|uniref:BadF/BadG/BcrA/BcrD ATPase family protein n=1 Tax=Catenovulum sp. 2E275 TaxID=2980497 RepID=UPI0021CFA160|nr:BadF/BadG/BcrA/BcrD ATPase family protein [Catenovulum sp. 2E275]MCU4676670.1 hypothetical protein [Catenovulum sp. 2E275]